MNCPKCNSRKIEVNDSRPSEMNSIRRRRICRECGYRFTSYELTIEQIIANNNMIRDGVKNNLIKSIDRIFERPVTDIERNCRKP